MTSARDAIYDISHQLTRQDHFQTATPQETSNPYSQVPRRRTIGIQRLIKQKLDHYIKQASFNVILIIDGLDEADFTILDPVSKKSEMEVFICHLANSNSQFVKVLFINRPVSVLENYISNALSMNLTFEKACLSIDSYVKRFLSNHPDIERMFFEAGIVPVVYFREHASGVFTWIQNALKELSSIRSPFHFRQCINDLAKNPALLEDAYSRILWDMSEDDAELARVIISCLAASKESMWLLQLQDD